MTVPLSPGSARGKAAAAFGRELRRVMTLRQVGQRTVREAAATGSTSSISQWKAGRNLPTYATALRLAEALQAPRLADIVREARTITCVVCGARFIYESGRWDRVRFCGNECQTYEADRKRDGYGRLVPAVVDLHLGRARAAIHRMCWECEPEGACRTAECPLRRVSPLPLIERPVVREARKKPGAWGSPENRAALTAGIQRSWDKDEDRHERVCAALRATWAAKTPEQRAEHGRRVSEARRRGSAAAMATHQ